LALTFFAEVVALVFFLRIAAFPVFAICEANLLFFDEVETEDETASSEALRFLDAEAV
jgi:hypothetical protein